MKRFLVVLLISALCFGAYAQNERKNSQPIGTIIASVIDYDNLTKVTDDPKVIDPKVSVWIPADGRSIAGSQFAKLTGMTNAPDLRGEFLRGLNTIHSDGAPVLNPSMADEGDPHNTRKAGDQETDELRKHSHGENSPNPGGNGSYTFSDRQAWTSGGQRGWGAKTDDAGGAETRPKNVAVYYYIKIN